MAIPHLLGQRTPRATWSTSPAIGTLSRLASIMLRGIATVGDEVDAMVERQAQRRRLAALPEHLLRDMGLSAGDVHREIAKPFWTP